MTPQQFDVMSAQFADLISNRQSAVGVRRVKTNEMMQLDAEFDARHQGHQILSDHQVWQTGI